MDRATSPVNPLTIGSCELAISAVQSGRARFPHPLLSHKPGRSRIVANPLVRPPSWRPLPLQFRLLRRPSTSTAGRQIRWLLSTTSLFPPLPSPSPTTRHPADTQAPAAASTFAQAVDPRRDLSPPPPTAPDAEAWESLCFSFAILPTSLSSSLNMRRHWPSLFPCPLPIACRARRRLHSLPELTPYQWSAQCTRPHSPEAVQSSLDAAATGG
jgi:hypothetical protein